MPLNSRDSSCGSQMPKLTFSRSSLSSSNALDDRDSARTSRSVEKLLASTRKHSTRKLPRARFFRRTPCLTLLVVNVCITCIIFVNMFSVFCLRRTFKADLARYRNEDQILRSQTPYQKDSHTLMHSLAHCPYEENVDYNTKMCAQMRIRDLTRVVEETRPPIWAVRRLDKTRAISIEYFSWEALQQCMNIVERYNCSENLSGVSWSRVRKWPASPDHGVCKRARTYEHDLFLPACPISTVGTSNCTELLNQTVHVNELIIRCPQCQKSLPFRPKWRINSTNIITFLRDGGCKTKLITIKRGWPLYESMCSTLLQNEDAAVKCIELGLNAEYHNTENQTISE